MSENTNSNSKNQKLKESKRCINSTDIIEELENSSKHQVLVYKLNYLQSENQKIMSENKTLEKEIQTLQENMRNMIPGFTSNTSNSFPMLTEMQNMIADYIKITCQDIFFDLLQPMFNIDKIVEFFSTIIHYFESKVESHFAPAEKKIKLMLKIDKLWDPIENVLRKSYQYNWRSIYSKLETPELYSKKLQDIIQKFNIDRNNESSCRMIYDFLKKTFEIEFLCYIYDPHIIIDRKQIGDEVYYNAITHDSFDGFIKPKQRCVMILPSFYIGKKTKETMIVKSQILARDYEFS